MEYIYIGVAVIVVCAVVMYLVWRFSTQVWLPDGRGMSDDASTPQRDKPLSTEAIKELEELHSPEEYKKLCEGNWDNEKEDKYIINHNYKQNT